MKLSNLTETRARVLYRGNGDNVGYYANKKARHPFVMVVPVNDNRFIIVAITRAGVKAYAELAERDYYAQRGQQDPLQPSEKDAKTVFMEYALVMDGSYNKFPGYFTEEDVDRNGLFQSLMNKHRIAPNTISVHWGEMPDMDSDEIFGDITINTPPNVTKRVMDSIKNTLEEVKETLRGVQLDSLISGKFRVAPLTGANATYAYGSGLTTLAPKGFGRGTANMTLVHEMGHKWDDVCNLDQVIIDKWNEVAKEGHNFTSTPALEPGDRFEMVGDQWKKYHGYVFEINKIDYMDKAGRTMEPKYVGVGVNTKKNTQMDISIPLRVFTAGGFQMHGGDEIPIENVNEWFPTKYSTSSPKEFFAENFMRYATGEANDLVTAWMDSLPRP